MLTDVKSNVVNKLKDMLTNHSDRPKYFLQVNIASSRDSHYTEFESFEIYANDPAEKIKEKVHKLKLHGGMTTLKISAIEKLDDAKYKLCLKY